MSVEIIYEKKYPRIDPMEEMKQKESEMADEPEELTLSFEELMQKIQANTTYVLMPERIKASEKFIHTAIEVSELYELVTRIEHHFDHISVTYPFDCCGVTRGRWFKVHHKNKIAAFPMGKLLFSVCQKRLYRSSCFW